MGEIGQLKRVEGQLIKDLMESSIPFRILGDKYGVTRQAISLFAIKRGIKRSKTEHTEKCPICQRLLRIAKERQSNFISWETIYKQLRLGRVEISYHICILRKHGLVSRNFGRIRTKKVELALQTYLKGRISAITIGRELGIRNLYSIIKRYKDSGWV